MELETAFMIAFLRPFSTCNPLVVDARKRFLVECAVAVEPPNGNAMVDLGFESSQTRTKAILPD